MPNTRSVVAAIVAAGVGYAVLEIGSWHSLPVVRTLNDLLLLSFALFATGCAVAAARAARGRRRAAWMWLAIGAAGWAVGQAMWTYFGLVHGVSPFQSIADASYVALPVGALIALAHLLHGFPRPVKFRVLLDGVIVGGAIFGAAWVTLLAPVLSVPGSNPVSLALTLAYPVAYLAVITIGLLILVRAPAGYRPPLALLTLGFVLMTVAEIAFAYLTAVQKVYYAYISVGWAWGFLLLGAAALISSGTPNELGRTQQGVPSRAATWVPFLPVAIAVAICTPAMVSQLGPLFIVGIITLVAVMFRQHLLLSENRRLLVEVSEQVLRDPLTGLANRTLFQDRLDHAMLLHQRDCRPVGVLLIDLDDFKMVNDSLGHPAGDAMLVRVGERLAGTVRASDTVARLGGDEFAVLMEGDVAASRVAAQRVVQAFDRPFVIDGQDLLVRPSVGLAVAGHTDSAVSAEELLRRSDVAMYAAKRSRSSQLFTFAPEMDMRRGGECVSPATNPELSGAGGRNSVHLLGELRQAIEHGGLSAVYQPKFDVRTHRIVGAEALVRWPHPRYGLLGPDDFLPLVREHGLMQSVTSLMLDLALDDTAEWYAEGVGVPVAVNVFAPSVSDADLPGRILRALERTGLPPEILTVEITEDVLLENMAETRSVFAMLRDCGIRIAIDDFGSGYSALWYLREFPVDEVKLDKEFIAPILTQPTSAAIVRAVIDLSHVLGVTPVAEGVEDAATAARLLAYGCDIAQGFYYSRPLAAHAMLELLQAQQPPEADDCRANGYSREGLRRKEIELMQ